MASSPTSVRPAGGSRRSSSTTRSRRSPVPWPCSAETGNGSPSPSRWNSTASRSRRGSSTLFARTTTRLRGPAQDVRHLLVAGRNTCLRVDDEEHQVGLVDRLPRLLGDLARDRRGVGDIDATGVDQPEALAVPLADHLLAIARDAGRLEHDCLARRRQPVDERRLADVREADDGDAPDHALTLLAARRPPGEAGLRGDLTARGTCALTGAPVRPSRRRGVRPAQPVHEDEELPQPADLDHELLRRLTVPGGVAGIVVKAHRLSEGDRDGLEVPVPVLGAVDGGG